MRRLITICVLILLSCASGFANGPAPRNADVYVGTVVVEGTASTTAKVEDLRAQQATETIDLLAAIGSNTLDVASVTAKVEELRAQQATESADLKAAIEAVEAVLRPVITVATQTITITGAAASAQVTSGLTGTRRYISISSQNVNQNVAIWINFGGAASTGVGELMYTGVSYPFDGNVDVWLYSDTTVDVYVIEGGTL